MSGAPPAAAGPRKARARRLACPGCGGSIEIRANGISISAICPSCGRTVDVASEDVRIIAEANAATRTLAIPIGTRGTLAGTEWEVVGYQARSNPAEGWTWDEYLLFNPYRGFRFLAHDDDGWTLYCMLRQDVPDPAHVEGDRQRYKGPDASQARTDYVLGEFYWRVRVGDMADIEQYEAGSSFLVKEVTGDEIVWSRGLKVPASEVETAFKLTPEPGARAPTNERERTIQVLSIGLAACFMLFVLYGIGFGASRSAQVYYQHYQVSVPDRGHPIASPPFTVPDRGGNLRLDIYAPVQNNWISLNMSLVGEAGTPVFNASSSIEHYSGYDSDGSWEEGSDYAHIRFRSIPGGVYRLVVDADAGVLEAAATPQSSVSFDIAVMRHVPAPELFWIGLLLIVPYPTYRLLFKRQTA